MNEQSYTSKPTKSGYYWCWDEGSTESDEPGIVKVYVERDEIFIVDRLAGRNHMHEIADYKLSEKRATFKGPYEKVEDMLG